MIKNLMEKYCIKNMIQVNLNSQLSFTNNEYIYKIKFDKTDNRSYFAKFTFNKV